MKAKDCTCESEFIWACGPECECFHHNAPERTARMATVKKKIREKLAAKPKLIPANPPPRYDEVFFRGLASAEEDMPPPAAGPWVSVAERTPEGEQRWVLVCKAGRAVPPMAWWTGGDDPKFVLDTTQMGITHWAEIHMPSAEVRP